MPNLPAECPVADIPGIMDPLACKGQCEKCKSDCADRHVIEWPVYDEAKGG